MRGPLARSSVRRNRAPSRWLAAAEARPGRRAPADTTRELRAVTSPRGFTLLEVTIALAVFATAIVTVAQLFCLSSRSARLARVSDTETALAAEKLEQLRALAWGYSADGAERTDTSTDVSVEPEAAGGVGLAPSSSSTLAANVPGFVDFLDDNGKWIGTGVAAPPGAAYVRRWSVSALDDSPSEAIVLRVVVARLEDTNRGEGAMRVGPATTQLVAVRSRRGQ